MSEDLERRLPELLREAAAAVRLHYAWDAAPSAASYDSGKKMRELALELDDVAFNLESKEPEVVHG